MKRKPIKEKYMGAISSIFLKELRYLRISNSISVIEFERMANKLREDFVNIIHYINDK
jgi:hypothetical protein